MDHEVFASGEPGDKRLAQLASLHTNSWSQTGECGIMLTIIQEYLTGIDGSSNAQLSGL